MHRAWNVIILKQAHPPSGSPGKRRHIRVGILPPRPLITLSEHQPFQNAVLYTLMAIRNLQKLWWALAELMVTWSRTLLLSSSMEFGATAPTPAARAREFCRLKSHMVITRTMHHTHALSTLEGKKPWPLCREASILICWASWTGTRTPSTEPWSFPGRMP